MADKRSFVPYVELLSSSQIQSLTNAACRLYAFVWNRMTISGTTTVSALDVDAMNRARIKPEELRWTQCELDNSGLIRCEPVVEPKPFTGNEWTRYSFIEDQPLDLDMR